MLQRIVLTILVVSLTVPGALAGSWIVATDGAVTTGAHMHTPKSGAGTAATRADPGASELTVRVVLQEYWFWAYVPGGLTHDWNLEGSARADGASLAGHSCNKVGSRVVPCVTVPAALA